MLRPVLQLAFMYDNMITHYGPFITIYDVVLTYYNHWSWSKDFEKNTTSIALIYLIRKNIYIFEFMTEISNDPPWVVVMTSSWQRFQARKRERVNKVFYLLFVLALKTSLPASYSSFLFPQIISSHAPVLWSLWGLLWLSYPCKSRGQPQPPVLRNICPQMEVLARHRSAASTPL